MHRIVSFAAPLSDAGRDALARLDTPHLDALVAASEIMARDIDDAHTPHAPHERALARAFGWPVAGDMPLPWAARAAAADGIDVRAHAWGLLTPSHWRVGSDTVLLLDPRDLALDADTSRALFDVVRPLYESEGFTLAWGAPLRWYLAHESLAGLVTASPARVIGRHVDPWLPVQREARLLRRLQNEVQMLLHTHPLNAAREAAGVLPVNSVWLSGCGVARAAASTALLLEERLEQPALTENWAGWQAAWSQIDAELRPLLPSERLTLCGERGFVTLRPRLTNPLQRMARRLKSPRGRARALLDTL